MRRWLLLIAVIALIALGWSQRRRLPDRYNPWAPLDLRAPPDLFLGYKLQRLDADAPRCLAALQQSGATFSIVRDYVGAGGCGWNHAVRLQDTGVARLERPTIVTCPLAASLVLFDRHALQPLARQWFGQPVVSISHVGSYACRTIYSQPDAALSRHARAEAIDVTGFRLGNGRAVVIAKDWDKGLDGTFLHKLEARGCPFFGIVLGPEYNAAHHTHFHLEAGSWGWCR
ncbi:extensin family protein [Dyella jejuensis]|uniref:Extensin family protein n=1 Tax=Dyella jejuensis TaxID=1432009 RepID=A0ABW8JHV8_9GAMM